MLCNQGLTQKTIVHGIVTDAETGEPLPFVRVFFNNTKISTTTDLEGKYRLASYYATDSVGADFVGYKRQLFKIKKDKEQEVNFELEASVAGLKEVKVQAPKEDPAIAMWKKIIRNKDANNREKLESYEYEVYNKIEFDLNNITDEFTERKVFKHFNFIFENIDSSETKPYLPMFLSESLSRFYYRKKPKSEKEYVKATKVSGVENESISQFLGDMYQNVNIYDNHIPVFGKTFISPLSTLGRVYYNFYLQDSSLIDDDWCYNILFTPKRKQEPTFTGDFWVNDTTWAIKEVDATIADDANINFVNELRVRQEYDQVQKEVWMLTKDNLLIDFYISNKAMGFYGRKTTTYRDFLINQPKEDEFYSGANNIVVADNVNKKSDEFWEDVRHEPLDKNESSIYYMMDTLERIPQVRTYIDVVTMLITGYKEFGNVEFGPYSSLYSFNPVEGSRVRFGGRTTRKFSKKIEFSAYGAYGFKDFKFKYGGGFRAMVSQKPRQEIGAYYKYDVEQLGQSQNAFRQDYVLASILRTNPNNKLTLVEQYKAYYDREWFPGFSSKIIFKRSNMEPLGSLSYLREDNSGTTETIDNITSTEISYYTRFAYNEKFVSGTFDHISLGTKYPVLEAQYTYGIPDLFGGDYEYHKLESSVSHWFSLGLIGWIKYKVNAGKIWGTLAYPLLEIHPGNETYYLDRASFNTMNFFEFISDEYVSATGTWHMEGLFLNKIPLLRKLKWREVVSFRVVWGSYDPKHNSELLLLDNMNDLSSKPFMEAGIGIENIFKVLRVDAIWRLSYLNHDNITKFGIRAMLDVDF